MKFALSVIAFTLAMVIVIFGISYLVRGEINSSGSARTTSVRATKQQVSCDTVLKVAKDGEADSKFCGYVDPMTGLYCYVAWGSTPMMECNPLSAKNTN